MSEDKFDGLFLTVAQQAGSIDNIFDSFFGFLGRRTDFYAGSESKEKAFGVVVKHFDTHWDAARKKVDEDKAKNAKIDEERKKKQAEKQKKEEEEWAAKQKAGKNAGKKEEDNEESKIEEVPADTPVGIVKDEKKADKESLLGTKDEKTAKKAKTEENEEEEDSGPPPVGNGGTTDKYTWTQTLQTADVFVNLKPGTKSKDLAVTIKQGSLKAAYKNDTQNPIVNGELFGKVLVDDSTWTLVDNKTLHITFEKADQMKWWESVIQGDPTIDTKKIIPENSKLSDLDGDTRMTVEKMMHDQKMKQMGKPTSDQQKQHDILDQFKQQHPEMDFSKCKVNYGGNEGGFGDGFGAGAFGQ